MKEKKSGSLSETVVGSFAVTLFILAAILGFSSSINVPDERWLVISAAGCLAVSGVLAGLNAIHEQLKRGNDLKEQELELRKKQIEKLGEIKVELP